MHYFLISLLYLYILIRLLLPAILRLSVWDQSRIRLFLLEKLSNTRIIMIEILIIGTVLIYILNHQYINIDRNISFIISSELIFLAFYVLTFLVGFALATKLILNLVQEATHIKQNIIFVSSIAHYQNIADMLIHLGITHVFFFYAVLEISQPVREIQELFTILLPSLGFLISIIYYTYYQKIEAKIGKVIIVSHFLILGLIILMIGEAKLDNIRSIPINLSLLIFHITFLGRMIMNKFGINHIRPISTVWRSHQKHTNVIYSNFTTSFNKYIGHDYLQPNQKNLDTIENSNLYDSPIRVSQSNNMISLRQLINRDY